MPEVTWDEKAEEIARVLVEEKAKGLEWLEPEDIDRIAFVHKSTRRGKIADIGRFSDKARFLISHLGKRYELLLTTYGWFEDETPEQKKATVHHELLHIDPEGEFKKLIKHDMEEFAIVMQEYEEVKDTVLKMLKKKKDEAEEKAEAEKKKRMQPSQS